MPTDNQALFRAVMHARGWTIRDAARESGYAQETIKCWLSDPGSKRYQRMPARALRWLRVTAFYAGVGMAN